MINISRELSLFLEIRLFLTNNLLELKKASYYRKPSRFDITSVYYDGSHNHGVDDHHRQQIHHLQE